MGNISLFCNTTHPCHIGALLRRTIHDVENVWIALWVFWTNSINIYLYNTVIIGITYNWFSFCLALCVTPSSEVNLVQRVLKRGKLLIRGHKSTADMKYITVDLQIGLVGNILHYGLWQTRIYLSSAALIGFGIYYYNSW